MENKFYSTPVTNETIIHLGTLGYDQLEDSVENLSENRCLIINKEDKIFWTSDETNLELAKELSEAKFEQPILQTDFNTILSWQN